MLDETLDRYELLRALYEGVREDPPWSTFLDRMLKFTGSQRVVISVRSVASGSQPLLERVAARPGTPNPDLLAIEGFSDSVLRAYGNLTPNRVHSLGELLVLDNEVDSIRQARALQDAQIRFARLMRLDLGGRYLGWISLLSDRADMHLQDSNTLVFLGRHVPAALEMFLDAEAMRIRAEMAEDALRQLGVGQAMFDEGGRIMLADRTAAEALRIEAGQRLHPADRASIRSACGALSGKPASAREVVRLEETPVTQMLLRPAATVATRTLETASAIGLVRMAPASRPANAEKVLAASLGISAQEAALAAAIGEGRNVKEAGMALGLRPQTARTYSKRLYAKTGTGGQAELSRRLHCGLLPFA